MKAKPKRHPGHVRVRLSAADRELIREAGWMNVVSQANGLLRVTPAWLSSIPKECGPQMCGEGNYCPRHDCHHIGGMFTRMALAELVARVLADVRRGVG